MEYAECVFGLGLVFHGSEVMSSAFVFVRSEPAVLEVSIKRTLLLAFLTRHAHVTDVCEPEQRICGTFSRHSVHFYRPVEWGLSRDFPLSCARSKPALESS